MNLNWKSICVVFTKPWYEFAALHKRRMMVNACNASMLEVVAQASEIQSYSWFEIKASLCSYYLFCLREGFCSFDFCFCLSSYHPYTGLCNIYIYIYTIKSWESMHSYHSGWNLEMLLTDLFTIFCLLYHCPTFTQWWHINLGFHYGKVREYGWLSFNKDGVGIPLIKLIKYFF